MRRVDTSQQLPQVNVLSSVLSTARHPFGGRYRYYLNRPASQEAGAACAGLQVDAVRDVEQREALEKFRVMVDVMFQQLEREPVTTP